MYEFTRNLLGRARFLYMEFYVRQYIASFAFMIFFCISYTLTIDVMADDLTSSRVGIDARSINRAYLTSFAAITNYDVRVHHWRSKIPSEETDLMNVQTTVEDVKYRLVANLNEPTCLLVESRSMIREATDKLPKSLEVRRYLSHYADGKAIFRTGGGSIFSEQPQPFSFEKFCQNSRVNRPAFMAIYPAYKFQGTAIEQTVSSLARAPKPTSDVERKLIVQELSSRLIKITTSPPPKAIGMTTTWVDTERLLPTKVENH